MKKKLFLIGFILLGLFFSLFQIFGKDAPAEISEKEVLDLATKLYGGKVLSYEEKNSSYEMTLENNSGVYFLVVDPKTEKVSNIKLLEKKDTLLTLEEATQMIEQKMDGEVKQIEQENKDRKNLAKPVVWKDNTQYSVVFDLAENKVLDTREMTRNGEPGGAGNVDAEAVYEQRAKEIALKQASGTVTNVTKVTNQKGVHYKVTIDNPQEVAHVYVQSETGKVSSVSSIPKKETDDQDDDDDDDDQDDDNDDNT